MGFVNNLKLKGFMIALINVFLFTATINAEIDYRSSSLKEVTSVSGDVERTDFIDKDGKITYAKDKHYATLIKTKRNHQVLEEFFDAAGEPAKQPKGYYAILREYNDDKKECKISFLNNNGVLMMTNYGYAIKKMTYNEQGLVEKELYYDTEECPVKSRYDGYGICRGYDDKERNTIIVHVDEYGAPMIAGNGYAKVYRSFYEDGYSAGRVRDEYYFDEFDKPAILSIGQSGLHKEYDELGRINVLTFLDANGEPIKTKKGYTTIIRTFYEDDSVKTEMYYDRDGRPTRLSDGQYGILKKDGKTVYLNSKGERLFQLKNFLINNQAVVILTVFAIVLLSSLCNFKYNIGMLVLYMAFIIYITLIHRNDVVTGIEYRFLWSYKQLLTSDALRWEIFNNILLFIPLGAILCKLYPHIPILLVPVLLSSAIELIQYLTTTGLCEIDDVVSNTLGEVIGYVLVNVFTKAMQVIKT